MASSRPAVCGTEEACLKVNTGSPVARRGPGPVAGDQDELWETQGDLVQREDECESHRGDVIKRSEMFFFL